MKKDNENTENRVAKAEDVHGEDIMDSSVGQGIEVLENILRQAREINSSVVSLEIDHTDGDRVKFYDGEGEEVKVNFGKDEKEEKSSDDLSNKSSQ